MLDVARGRFLAVSDERERRGCVLGPTVARDLFAWRDPLGAQVRIGQEWFLVVGVLEPKRDAAPAMGLAVSDFDRSIYLPIATERTRFGITSVSLDAGSMSAERVEISDLVLRFEDGVDVTSRGDFHSAGFGAQAR